MSWLRNFSPLDLLAASIPNTDKERREAFGLTLRFLRARKPMAFLLVGRETGSEDELFRPTRSKTQRMGYHVSHINGNGHTFPMGALPGVSFVWPSGVVPRRHGDNASTSSNERPDEGSLEVFGSPNPALDEGESPELDYVEAMVKMAAMAIRERTRRMLEGE